MRNMLGILTVLTGIFIANACQKDASYPAEPQISLNSYSFVDTLDPNVSQVKEKRLTISLHFTDGDGDLFTPNVSKDSTDLRAKIHLLFYKKENGVFTLVPDLFWSTPYNFNLPYSDVMERNGQNKTQKG